jgi:hypothetical protein
MLGSLRRAQTLADEIGASRDRFGISELPDGGKATMHDRWWIPRLAGLVAFPLGVVLVRFSAGNELGASQAFRSWMVLLGGLACLVGSVVILIQQVF